MSWFSLILSSGAALHETLNPWACLVRVLKDEEAVKVDVGVHEEVVKVVESRSEDAIIL